MPCPRGTSMRPRAAQQTGRRRCVAKRAGLSVCSLARGPAESQVRRVRRDGWHAVSDSIGLASLAPQLRNMMSGTIVMVDRRWAALGRANPTLEAPDKQRCATPHPPRRSIWTPRRGVLRGDSGCRANCCACPRRRHLLPVQTRWGPWRRGMVWCARWAAAGRWGCGGRGLTRAREAPESD